MTQNRQFLFKDLPKYDVAMNLNAKKDVEGFKEDMIDNEFKMIAETMKDIERMRI